jgi:hypothetical protein
MNKKATVLGILGAAGLGWWLWGYAGTGNKLLKMKPYFLAGRYKSSGSLLANLLNTKLETDLVIENPNKDTVNFSSIAGEFLYDKKVIGSIDLNRVIPIKGNEKTMLKGLPIVLNNFSAMAALLDIIKKGGQTKLKFKGNMKAGGFKYPIDQDIEFKKT